ncbi:MAG: RNA polymerase factor sigma-54 [Bacteroidota bacterium]
MLKQGLYQKQLQKLSPQQILLMKILQIPVMELDQRIQEEIEQNPVLEDLSDPNSEPDSDPGHDGWEEEEYKPEEETIIKDKEVDLTEYYDEYETPSYLMKNPNTSSDDERPSIPFVSDSTFQESLITQLGLRKLTEKQYKIGLTLIGNLDDSGYLRRETKAMVDDLLFSQNISATEFEILDVLEIIQEFDPAGVGAREPQECLIIQLKKIEKQTPVVKIAIKILDNHFEEFTKKHYDKITKRMKITEDELKAAMGLILKLNPKPGSAFGGEGRSVQYILPDFNVINFDGELDLTLNSRNAPELRVNRSYLDMMEAYSLEKHKSSQHKDALQFIKQKIDSAKWFIEALKQRQNTLLLTMQAIMDYQREFFLTGDEIMLKPMILKDIAEIVKLDISTVSRVANSKYVQTPYGTFLLKFFFSESMQTDSGEEVSTREIKKILEDCINEEDKDKPLTDEELTDILKSKGYNIARRTVAKYREHLEIPVARMRKSL